MYIDTLTNSGTAMDGGLRYRPDAAGCPDA
jgi:hypothetical protein